MHNMYRLFGLLLITYILNIWLAIPFTSLVASGQGRVLGGRADAPCRLLTATTTEHDSEPGPCPALPTTTVFVVNEVPRPTEISVDVGLLTSASQHQVPVSQSIAGRVGQVEVYRSFSV